MKNTIKPIITLMCAVIFVFPANAEWQGYSDVKTSDWHYPYVQKLTEEGVFDKTDSFHPDEPITRGELVKIIMKATGGMKDYESPGVPTFADVPEDAWFYDYVEAALQKGIVSGYTDSNGDLSGYFGPSDLINRAAATKILVNAFNIPASSKTDPGFPDVKSKDWFYGYVLTVYNQSVVDGYTSGYFGPSDSITRAQIAKMIIKARSPKIRSTVSKNISWETSK